MTDGPHEQDINALTADAYAELKRLAAYHLKGERAHHTLRPTDLVHEAYLKLVGQRSLDGIERVHFLSLASTLMRRVLVDHARRKNRHKRGDGQENVPIDTISIATQFGSEALLADLLAIDECLVALGKNDPRQVEIVEMHFFGGLTFEEIAETTGISLSTVMREWRFARTWLYRRLVAGDGDKK